MLAHQIEDIVRSSGLTVAKIAQELGVDRTVPYTWMSGRTPPNDEPQVKALCGVCKAGTSATDLMLRTWNAAKGHSVEATEKPDAMREQLAREQITVANIATNTGQLQKAEASLKRAIELDCHSAHAHNNLANIYWHWKEMDKAEWHYREAIRIDPDFALPHNGLANVLADRGDFQDAKARYELSISLDPTHSYPYAGLGNVTRKLGDVEHSRSWYIKATELDAQNRYAWQGLADLETLLGNFEAAADAAAHMLELGPTALFPVYDPPPKAT